MKSGIVEPSRPKIKNRRSVHRRKMSKNSPVVNGADKSLSYAVDDESVVRQINLAAAFHDHISCTKSVDFTETDGTREPKTSLPCETDHIYANCSELRKYPLSSKCSTIPQRSFVDENKQLKKVLFVQLELIKQLEEEILIKNRQIRTHKQESDMLRARLDRKEKSCMLRKRRRKSSDEGSETNLVVPVETIPNSLPSCAESEDSNEVLNTIAPPTVAAIPAPPEPTNTVPPRVNLVTRYFGRRSKTIPSRALKRRYLGPPKLIPAKKPQPKTPSSATSVSSTSDVPKESLSKLEETPQKTEQIVDEAPVVTIKKFLKRGRKSKRSTAKSDFLTTDKLYYLPQNQLCSSDDASERITVPSWRVKPVTSFYHMEGTENINDIVFQRRHLKYEQDERRRKRWDIQRLREQKAKEKLKQKYSKDTKKSDNSEENIESLQHDHKCIQYIEFTNQLPVLAFGHLVPLFQPSEFSLPWKPGERPSTSAETAPVIPAKVTKKSRLSAASLKT